MYKIKKPAEIAYQAIVRQLPEISSLFVAPYRIPPKYEDRVLGQAGDKQLLIKARDHRDKLKIPFWDAVITEAMAIGPINELIIDGILYHQNINENVYEIHRSDILCAGIVKSIDKAGIKYPWAVLSRVRTKHGKELHVPMLDFRCQVSEFNLISLQRIAHQLLNCPWVIIESDMSYHLVGASLINYKEFSAFLGKAVLLGPLVDRNYIAHQLINGCAGLRIVGPTSKSALNTRYTTFPRDSWQR